jgi:hypothetical protein
LTCSVGAGCIGEKVMEAYAQESPAHTLSIV